MLYGDRVLSISMNGSITASLALNGTTSQPLSLIGDMMLRTSVPVSSHVWSDGRTYTIYDSDDNPVQMPVCGWRWGDSNVVWG